MERNNNQSFGDLFPDCYNQTHNAKNGNGTTLVKAQVANPLLAPYLKAGATQEQLEFPLEKSQGPAWYTLIAPRMRTNLSYREAEALVEWATERIREADPWNCPVALAPGAEMYKWLAVVRKSLGLRSEFTFKENVLNRVERIHSLGDCPTMPLTSEEKLAVWLCAIFYSLAVHLIWVIIGIAVGFLFGSVVALLYAGVVIAIGAVFGAIRDFFRA